MKYQQKTYRRDKFNKEQIRKSNHRRYDSPINYLRNDYSHKRSSSNYDTPRYERDSYDHNSRSSKHSKSKNDRNDRKSHRSKVTPLCSPLQKSSKSKDRRDFEREYGNEVSDHHTNTIMSKIQKHQEKKHKVKLLENKSNSPVKKRRLKEESKKVSSRDYFGIQEDDLITTENGTTEVDIDQKGKKFENGGVN